MNLAIAILGLGLLILVHEAGHFFTARAVGMRPRRFYVGFPPALVKLERNGIEYGLGAIPLGGYVKIPGMHRPAESDLDSHFARAVHEVSELVGPLNAVKRGIASGNLEEAAEALPRLEALLDASELSPEARKPASRGISEIRDGLGADAYWRQPTWKRVAVIFAGPGTNMVFAIAVFALLFTLGGGKATTTVDGVLADRPASQSGLRAGDRITVIDGRPIVEPAQIPRRISASDGRPLTLVVDRHGQRVTLRPARARKEDGAYRLGFVLRGEGLSPPAAAWSSIRLTGEVTRQIFTSLGRLVHSSGRKEIASPVGIVQGSSNALTQGTQNYLWVLGLISLSLALLNLLPLLPLDGGHILFSLVEGLRGKAVGREVYERVSAVGIALVLMLWFIGLSNDIGRLGGG